MALSNVLLSIFPYICKCTIILLQDKFEERITNLGTDFVPRKLEKKGNVL